MATDTAPPAPTQGSLVDEGSYHSSSDEDFDANAPQDDPSSSDDEADANSNKRPKKKRKISKEDTRCKAATKGGDGEDFVMDMKDLDSGDEAMIRSGERKMARRKKKMGKGKGAEEDNEQDFEGESSGGEGGVVRTRLMRAKEKVESKKQVNTTASNIDVDALWAQMNGPGDPAPVALREDEDDDIPIKGASPSAKPASPIALEQTITFQRTTRFAGETTIEDITVPISSETAKLHLAAVASKSQAPRLEQPSERFPNGQRRPLARLSAFDPNPPDRYPRPFSTARKVNTAQTELTAKIGQPDKMNTVDKSKLDWAKYVDQEGIKEELVKGGRAKESYIARKGFLDDVERRRDEELMEARRAGRG